MTLSPASSVPEIVSELKARRSEDNIAGMTRFGIVADKAVGISNPDLQKLARLIKTNHARAFELWATDIREARLLALYTFDASALTVADIRRLVADFNSWEIVDAAADLLTQTSFWRDLIQEFAADDREFVRRTAFSMIAGATVHNKSEPDDTLLGFLPLVEAHSTDARNFVCKAVNWSLRNIGKRNRHCHGPALAMAEKLATSKDKTARWIGKDAVKELTSEKVLARTAARS
ncbi:DNA alkylation repair protein [Rhizobium sp. RU36D]|uniref:DNA alkylation repair protein n=1 Tax=Rhizobium sp. RU36D TaxID=1907415 RepID=UPI0009D8513E|nr:DNA alkylation repair protein [Rhizobium sp. RU36D]SMC80522.1 3-methyladenine DNA glycosylase AlkD [Rhizobium sp. RU36D]